MQHQLSSWYYFNENLVNKLLFLLYYFITYGCYPSTQVSACAHYTEVPASYNQPYLHLLTKTIFVCPLLPFTNGSNKYKFNDNIKMYFVSFTIVYWIDLFVKNEYREILPDRFKYCQRNKGLDVYAWCIMISHIHLDNR